MSTHHNPNEHPRAGDGKFAEKPRGEDPGVVLTTPAPSPPPPLTPKDVEHLIASKGAFENGYTPEDADRVLSGFESATFEVVWDYHDEDDFGGDSFVAGFPSESRASGPLGTGRAVPYRCASLADYRGIHPDAWEYLTDPDTDLDPESIPSLLESEPAHINGGEIYEFSVGQGTQWAFETSGDDDTEW